MTTTTQPTTTTLTGSPGSTTSAALRGLLAVMVEAMEEDRWVTSFSPERDLLRRAGIDPAPVDAVMRDNFDVVWSSNVTLSRSGLDVVKNVSDDYRTFRAILDKQRAELGLINENLQALSRDQLALAKLAPGMAKSVRESIFESQRAYTDFLDASAEFTRDLRSVVWRGKWKRRLYDSLHTVIVLLVFTFLFGAIAERACEGIQKALDVTIAANYCKYMQYVATVVLFAAERLSLGPFVDRLIAKYEDPAAANACNRFYYRYTRSLYLMAFIREEAERVRDRLKAVGVTV